MLTNCHKVVKKPGAVKYPVQEVIEWQFSTALFHITVNVMLDS